MNDKMLRAFLATAKCGSITKAADALYISTPALKKQLDALETECGVSLLDRNNQGCILTTAGEAVLYKAERLLSDIDELISVAQNAASEQAIITLCSLPDTPLNTRDEYCLKYLQQHPSVSFQHVRAPYGSWTDLLVSGKADICAFFSSPDYSAFPQKNLTYIDTGTFMPLTCVVSPSHPFASHSSLCLNDLAGAKFFMLETLYLYGDFSVLADSHNLDITPDKSANFFYEMIDHCRNGMAYIQPRDFAQQLSPLITIPLRDMYVKINWVFRKNPSPQLRQFADFLWSVRQGAENGVRYI